MTDPTLGELARGLDDVRASVRDRLHRETYQSDQRGLEAELGRMRKDHADLEAELQGRERERKADRRVMYGAVLAAAATIGLDIYKGTQGVS